MQRQICIKNSSIKDWRINTAKQYNVYDIYDHEICDYIAKQADRIRVLELLDINPKYICKYASTGSKYRGRYTLTATQIAQYNYTPSKGGGTQAVQYKELWSAEWDRVRSDYKLWRTINPNLLGEYGR